MTEETKGADRNGAYGILGAVISSSILGFAYLLGIIFATADPAQALDPANDAAGYTIGQVFYDAFYSRYGSGVGGIVALGVVGTAIWFGGIACMTSNSRMVFAFSRDGALPLSRLWHKVNKRDIPIYAVWLSALMGLLIALPSLGSLMAFNAMISIATVATYIAQFGFCGTTSAYCGTGCQSNCIPQSPPGPPVYSTSGLDKVLNESLFETLWPDINNFYTYNLLILAGNKYPIFGTCKNESNALREIAAFAADVQQETAGLVYITEIAKSFNYCDNIGVQYPCAYNQSYYGRGPLQISWNYNYGAKAHLDKT